MGTYQGQCLRGVGNGYGKYPILCYQNDCLLDTTAQCFGRSCSLDLSHRPELNFVSDMPSVWSPTLVSRLVLMLKM